MLGDSMFSTTNKTGYGLTAISFFYYHTKKSLKFYKYLLTNMSIYSIIVLQKITNEREMIKNDKPKTKKQIL